jgi:hypothetical protein
MPRQTRPRLTRLQPLHFANSLELIRSVVKMVFGGPPRTPRARTPVQSNSASPAWCRYLQPRPSPSWRKFTPEERQRATSIIESYFAPLIDSPAQDFNLLFFRGYEQQGSNFLADILPTYKLKLGDPPWSTVVATLGTLLEPEAKALRYDRKQSGTLRRSFFRDIRTKRGGKELIATLKQHSPQGRNGWQLLWQMIRGCAAVESWGFDFGRALRESGIIEFLEAPVPVDGEWALATLVDRRDRFSDFVNGLPGIGWSTFDYLLRDLQFPGCLSLFKVDSTNEAFIEKVFGSKVNGDRKKYLEILAESGILDEYPPAVINMAIYVFTSRNGLGYLRMLRADPEGGFTLNVDGEEIHLGG